MALESRPPLPFTFPVAMSWSALQFDQTASHHLHLCTLRCLQEDAVAELRAENKMLGKIIRELQAELKEKDRQLQSASAATSSAQRGAAAGPARGLNLKVGRAEHSRAAGGTQSNCPFRPASVSVKQPRHL